jgi:hypothetical protein
MTVTLSVALFCLDVTVLFWLPPGPRPTGRYIWPVRLFQEVRISMVLVYPEAFYIGKELYVPP